MQHDEPSDRAVVDPSNQPIVRLKHRSVVLPDRRRVVINLKLNATDPNYAIALQLTDLPLRPNDSDLILMTKNYYLIENRWKFDNELVDYRVIQFFDTGERFDVNFQSLKRIKIYGLRNELSSRAQIDLLMILCSCTQVEHLEMDTLDVVEDSDTDLSFNSLRLFSIDSIQIVDKNGREVAEKRATIRLKAPQLEKVYSGSNSIDYLVFANCNLRSLFIQGVLASEKFAEVQFQNLQNLECTQIQSDQAAVLRQIVEGALLPHLEKLSCNFNNLESTTYKPGGVEQVLLQEFYEWLFSRSTSLRKSLRIYIHGLLFEPNRQYEYCAFHLSLIQFHFHNTGGTYQVQPCPSVSKVDYLDAYDTFVASETGTGTFFTYYPNVRIIIVNNDVDEANRRQISIPDLFSFLGLCTGLTELELRFAQVNSYYFSQMMELPSLAKLHSLTLLERPGELKQSIDFGTLSNRFTHLRNLHTNLATKQVMLELLEKMQIGSYYIFDFWVQDSTYHQCFVLRRRDTYNLLVATQDDQPSKELHRKTFTSLPYLLKNLTEPNPIFPLNHWLDGTEPNWFL